MPGLLTDMLFDNITQVGQKMGLLGPSPAQTAPDRDWETQYQH